MDNNINSSWALITYTTDGERIHFQTGMSGCTPVSLRAPQWAVDLGTATPSTTQMQSILSVESSSSTVTAPECLQRLLKYGSQMQTTQAFNSRSYAD